METKNRETFFNEIFVFSLNLDSDTEVLEKLSEVLIESGMVKKEFQEAVIKRENAFPTGIPTLIPAALPHADAGFCLESALAVGILETPVPFGLMGGENGDEVLVQAVFMLSLPDPKSQIAVIQRMLEMLRDGQTMQKLIKYGKDDICKVKATLSDFFSQDGLHYSEKEQKQNKEK